MLLGSFGLGLNHSHLLWGFGGAASCSRVFSETTHFSESERFREFVENKDIVPANFDMFQGLEGPQIVISWDRPNRYDCTTSIRLVRRLHGFPKDENDGVIVYPETGTEAPPTSGVISDTDLQGGECYYYRFFALRTEGIWVSDPSAQGFKIAIETGFFKHKLFELLPPVYQANDASSIIPEQQTVLQTTTDSTGEKFNFDEKSADGRERGPLQRFLMVFGRSLDTAKGLADAIPRQFNVDEACADFLPHMARLLDFGFNEDVPIFQQREEIKNKVSQYKIKGTIPGIESVIRTIAQTDGEVDELCDNIVVFNVPGRGFASNDPLDLALMGRPGDPTPMVLGPGLQRAIRVFVKQNSSEPVSSALRAKLNRLIPEFVPFCADAEKILFTEDLDEVEPL